MKPRGKMWVLHFIICYVIFQFSVGCLATARGAESCKSSCGVQSEDGATDDSNVCTFDYHHTNAPVDARAFNGLNITSQSEDSDMNVLQMESWPISDSNSAVNFSLKVNIPGEVVLALRGVSFRNERCLVICFERRSEWHTSTLNASCVKFPNGDYNATVMINTGTAGKGMSCATWEEMFLDSPNEDIIILSHSRLLLTSPLLDGAFNYPWDNKLNRKRRMDDLLWDRDEAKVMPRCPCYTCLNTRHNYDNSTALLQLSYGVNITDDCCSNCLSLNLVLYQYVSVNEEKLCTDLNFTTSVISGLRLVTQDKNVSHGPIEYPNVGSGCYAFRLRPMVNPSPIYHGFFWLRSSGNVTNMNDWNTTFYLQPYPDQESFEVKWTAPIYPYNFSHYELQLWHHKNVSIKCRGENLYDGPIVVIPESGKIFLASTNYHFHNLSSGWYCARVTPVDPRCPPDGCEPRSSLAKLLKEGSPWRVDEEADNDVAPILIGAAAGVLVAGVMLACVVLRCRASHNFFHSANTKVSGSRRLGDVQEILLVWTAFGLDGAHLSPVIQSFKKILTSYSRCKVYDYLDLRSIPAQQREHLLASPTAWLDTLLNQHKVKILVVGSEGGRSRQLQWMTPTGGSSEVVSDLQPQDAQLFPYLLRRLQDRPDLAADYSRVFHVRFNDISSERAELEGVVSWTRYRLPQHLKSLTLALHGMREEDSSCLEEPTTETIQGLQRALASHPLYASRSTATNNSTLNHLNTSMTPDLYSKGSRTPYISPTEHHPLLNDHDGTPCGTESISQNNMKQQNHISDMTGNCYPLTNDVGGTHDDKAAFTCISVGSEAPSDNNEWPSNIHSKDHDPFISTPVKGNGNIK